MLTITFLADRANFLAGGGDMVLLLLVPSAVVLLLPLLRACGLTLAVFCSSARCERSTLLAGDDRPLETFLGVEGVSPTGALFGQTESWIQGDASTCKSQFQYIDDTYEENQISFVFQSPQTCERTTDAFTQAGVATNLRVGGVRRGRV